MKAEKMKKREKEKKIKPTKEERAASRKAARALFAAEVKEGREFLYGNRYEMIAWIGCWFGIALVSLFFTKWTTQADSFPWVVLNVGTRALSLIAVTLFGTLTPFRKSVFAAGATGWMIWILLLSNVSYGVAAIVFLLGGAVTFRMAWIEIKSFRAGGKREVPQRFREWVVFFYLILALAFVVEIIHSLKFNKPFLSLQSTFVMLLTNPDRFMNNVLVLLFTGSFIMICRRRKCAALIFAIVWVTLSFISLLKIHNVYEPLMVLDVFATMDMAAVVTKYFKWFFFVLLAAVLAGLAFLIVWLVKKEKKVHVRGDAVVIAVSIAVLSLLAYICACLMPYARFENTFAITNYYRQGFASSFVRTTLRSIPSAPDNYSEENFDGIKNEVEKEYEPKTPLDVKNVVVIQMEAFWDPYEFSKRNPEIEFEFDPTPFMHSLFKNYSTGAVTVPVYAGQTVKSEFEFLSGVSLRNLPNGFNPYVTSLTSTKIDSLARTFAEKGYSTTAIHNYQGEFFSRHVVYGNLGFETFVPMECMQNVRRRGSDIWASDDVLADQISKALDRNQGPDFVFTVSVQLHGSYPVLEPSAYPMTIKGLEGERDKEGMLQYYVAQLIEFDNAIRAVVEMLEKREEPTVLLLYADHLPQLANRICALTNEDTFKTRYYMWDNIGLEKADGDVNLWQLSTRLLNKIGMDGGFINKFHNVYSGRQSEVYAEAAEIVGHRLVFEETEAFENDKPLAIGIDRPEILSVAPGKEGHGAFRNSYTLTGVGITDDTVVTVNGRSYNLNREEGLTYAFETGLSQIKEGDVLTLRIVGERLGTVFVESREFVYRAPGTEGTEDVEAGNSEPGATAEPQEPAGENEG